MVERGEEQKVLRPKGYSETKFANYVSQVYERFRDIVPPLLVTLEEVKQEYAGSRESGLADKASKADVVMGKLYNSTFLLELSSLVDIYKEYGAISEILQIVDLMPFDRKDRFDRQLGKFQDMLKYLDVNVCPCSQYFDYSLGQYRVIEGENEKKKAVDVCWWKTLHGDLREMKMQSTYRGMVVGCLVEDGSKTRAGRMVGEAAKCLNLDKVVETVFKRACSVTTFLLRGLSEVYTSTDVTLIENIRRLLDLKSLSRTILLHGAPNVASTKWRGFREATVFIEPDIFARLSADELRLQFRDFVNKLGVLGDMEEDNTTIFAKFLNPATGPYRCGFYLPLM